MSAFQSRAVAGSGYASRVYATNGTTGWDSTVGAQMSTGRDLDVAIQGDGFIAVQGRDGREAYTRAGDLHVDPNGQLLNGSNLPVLGDGGPISVPPNSSLAIAADGSISIVPLGQGAETTATIGRIKLVNAPASQMERGEDGLFRSRDGQDLQADANSARRLRRARVEQRECRRVHGEHDRARAELRAAGQGHQDRRRQRRRRDSVVAHLTRPPLKGTIAMNPALWAAKTGLDAQNTRMTVTSNNLANVATNGFKKDRATFEDLLYQNVKQVGSATSQDTMSPSGVSLGTGVRVVSTAKSYTQGNLLTTNNSLDLAIEGRGFFQIQMPDGSTGYTRDGAFQTNAQGEVVTSNGYRLQPGINIPQGALSIAIGMDGVVTAQMPNQAAPVQIGSIQLADFVNPTGLEARGGNLVFETASSGPAQPGTPGLNGLGQLQQGSLESSNVNVVEELVSMIETQRAYEMNSKAIATTDQMLQYVTNNI